MDDHDLENAEVQLSSLLHKCESVLESSSLSASRQSMMTRRVEALRTALLLLEAAQERGEE